MQGLHNNTHTQGRVMAGLEYSELRKHSGQYIISLTKLIDNEEEIEVFGRAEEEAGRFVVFKKTEADRLRHMMFRDGNAGNVNVDDTRYSRIIPPNEIPLSEQYLETINGTKINFGNIVKSNRIKNEKGYNVGDVAEAIYAAAIASCMLNENVDEETIKDILRKCGNVAQTQNTTTHSKLEIDNVSLNIGLSHQNYKSLLEMISDTGKIMPDVKGVFKSAINYVETHEDILNIKSKFQNNIETITISASGLEDQKGQKADIFIYLGNEQLKLISLKAGKVKQFGQRCVTTSDSLKQFYNEVFGVDTPEKYCKNIDTPTDNEEKTLEIIKYKREYLLPELKKKEQTQKFKNKVFETIEKHASGPHNEEVFELLITWASPTLDKYKVMKFDKSLHWKLMRMNFEFVLPEGKSKTSQTLKIYAAEKDIQHLDIPESPDRRMLFQLRTCYKDEIPRIIIEMGPLLKAIS